MDGDQNRYVYMSLAQGRGAFNAGSIFCAFPSKRGMSSAPDQCMGSYMDVYQIWFDLKPDTDERKFAEALTLFLDHMEEKRAIETWRMLRNKLGFRPEAFPEFVILVETQDLEQLDKAFNAAAAREGLTDELHFKANAMVQNVRFALYRDWPDWQE